ncbi:hypothetical protein BC826DRAFT_965365 [Russula brevipes]|nr:hypothetical protein BC826DRAFT_965365 [Russula brevipes]
MALRDTCVFVFQMNIPAFVGHAGPVFSHLRMGGIISEERGRASVIVSTTLRTFVGAKRCVPTTLKPSDALALWPSKIKRPVICLFVSTNDPTTPSHGPLYCGVSRAPEAGYEDDRNRWMSPRSKGFGAPMKWPAFGTGAEHRPTIHHAAPIDCNTLRDGLQAGGRKIRESRLKNATARDDIGGGHVDMA